MRRTVLSLAALICGGGQAFAAPQCPLEITVSQTLPQPVAGWQSFQKATPSRLSGIALYDGPPAEDAQLAPDSFQKAKTTETATWKLSPEPGRKIWIVCLYSETTQSLAQELPQNTKSCTATYDARQKIAGQSVMEKYACK